VERLKQVFAEVLSLDLDTDWGAVEYQRTEGWDSIAHMSLVADIEDQFDVMLDVDDVLDMSSFHKATEILGKLGVVL
jgi:acyl carrier protein